MTAPGLSRPLPARPELTLAEKVAARTAALRAALNAYRGDNVYDDVCRPHRAYSERLTQLVEHGESGTLDLGGPWPTTIDGIVLGYVSGQGWVVVDEVDGSGQPWPAPRDSQSYEEWLASWR